MFYVEPFRQKKIYLEAPLFLRVYTTIKIKTWQKKIDKVAQFMWQIECKPVL